MYSRRDITFVPQSKVGNVSQALARSVAARGFAERHAGFLTNSDIFAPEEWDQEPVYRDIWRPVGIGWSAGTAIPIPTGDTLSTSRCFENVGE
jgi:hypothetical protein